MKVEHSLIALLLVAVSIPWSAVADSNPERGAELYESRCIACHSLDANRIGPKHRGVFGRRAGAVDGYRYSKAVAASDIRWNEDTLDRWLTNPESLIPGQRMGFRVSSARDRTDIIAFLKRESSHPE